MDNTPFFNTPDKGENTCGYCEKTAGSDLFRVVDVNGNKWNWSQCPSCGACSITPRPTPAQLSVAYDTSYYGASTTKYRWGFAKLSEYLHGRHARRLSRGIPAGANVLDLGCGNGDFLAALGKNGDFNLYGVELPGGSADRAATRKNINLTVGTIVEAGYPPGYFDMVTMFQVFEHLAEPRKTLKIVHSVLKAKGRLVLAVPNISSAQAKLFGPNWFHLDPPRHLFLMPGDSFAKAMNELGFSIESRRYFFPKMNCYGFIQSTLNCLFAQRDILHERLKRNKTYAPAHGTASFILQLAAAAALFPVALLLDIVESVFKRGATVEYVLRKQ